MFPITKVTLSKDGSIYIIIGILKIKISHSYNFLKTSCGLNLFMIHTHVNSSLAVDLDHNKKIVIFLFLSFVSKYFFPLVLGHPGL